MLEKMQATSTYLTRSERASNDKSRTGTKLVTAVIGDYGVRSMWLIGGGVRHKLRGGGVLLGR